jgi:hypothetical protein
MMMKRGVAGLLGMLVLSMVLPLPVFGQGPGATVTATLTMGATACLIASPSSVSFGILAFTQPGAAPQPATVSISLHNCSAQAANVLARGGTATGVVGWAHALPPLGVCPVPNTFIQGVRESAGEEKRLSLTNQPFTTVQPGASTPVTLSFLPPCSGSAGGGQSITLTYTFTATAAGP